ncbi:MBL fold metallo-hydrolase [uncultured Sphingomonas sp.]|uniref:MBL fold metallo-hydrolase n=1 Tax=uncultured Sphingomonas sp. TaxID=158754 RepID=UPI002600EE1C|nr:MBL fold metallo-hydrolase [uncultured Sphingomonas sp.]
MLRFSLIALLALIVAPPAVSQSTGGNSFVTLGTMGGPVANPKRSQPANLLLRGKDAYLVDCGDGAVQQMGKAGVLLPQVRAVFLSHLHVDHTGGLAALLGLRNQTEIRSVLTVYGPPGTKALVDGIVASMAPAAKAGYGYPGQSWADPASIVTVVEFGDDARVSIDGMTVTAVQNTHYDFPRGSAEDTAYKSLSLRFDLPDRSIVYTGDTGPSTAVERLAKGADLLVSEMIDVEGTLGVVRHNAPNMPPPAQQKLIRHLTMHHLTPGDVAALSQRAGVKAVAITHFSAGPDNPERTARDLATIAQTYAGPVRIANDLDRF